MTSHKFTFRLKFRRVMPEGICERLATGDFEMKNHPAERPPIADVMTSLLTAMQTTELGLADAQQISISLRRVTSRKPKRRAAK